MKAAASGKIIWEDNEIVRRIKKKHSFAILDDSVETSARAYLQVGIIKMQMIFLMIFLLYFLAVKQETLADFKRKTISWIVSSNQNRLELLTESLYENCL